MSQVAYAKERRGKTVGITHPGGIGCAPEQRSSSSRLGAGLGVWVGHHTFLFLFTMCLFVTSVG
jgi:hypothetical protein